MSAEENKAVSRAFYEGYSKPGTEGVDAAAAVIHAGMHAYGYPVGPQDYDGYLKLGHMYKNAFPDVVATIEEQLVDGDRVTNRVTWRGTHTGDFMGIPPKGKSFELMAIELDRIKDGKIVERYSVTDNLSLMQQLGLAAAPGQ